MALHFICIPTVNKCNRLRLKYGGPRLSDVTILQRNISVQNVTKKTSFSKWRAIYTRWLCCSQLLRLAPYKCFTRCVFIR